MGWYCSRKEYKLDSVMMYRLEELTKLAAEFGLDVARVDAHRIEMHLTSDVVLVFWNLVERDLSIVGFDGTPWHSQDIVQFRTGARTMEEYDELDILIGLGSGELLVISQYLQGDLKDRWLAHKEGLVYDIKYIEPGEELRVLRIGPLSVKDSP